MPALNPGGGSGGTEDEGTLPPPEPVPRYVIVAYDPWGDERDEIFDHSGWNLTRGWLAEVRLGIAHGRTAENFDELKDARLRVYRLDPDTDERLKIRNGVLIPATENRDRRAPGREAALEFSSIDALLYAAMLGEPTNVDVETGAKAPVVQWTAGPTMTAGRMLKGPIDDARARDGTAADPADTALWGAGIRFAFTLTHDSLGNLWSWTLDEDFELPITESIGGLRDWLTDQGAIDWWWEAHDDDDKEWLVVVNAGAGSTDRSVKDTAEYVEVFDSAVQKAPESKDETGLATHARVVGENGIYGWSWNEDAVSPFGRRELPVDAAGLTHPDGIDHRARGPLRAAQRAAESIRRDLSAHDEGVAWVDRDFELGDNLAVQRDHELDEPDDADDEFRSLQAIVAGIDVSPSGVTGGYVIYNSRQEQALVRIARQQHRANRGASVGQGGAPTKPLRDKRVPLAPTTPGASITYDLVGGETRAVVTTTSDAVTQAPSLYDTLVLEDIEIKEYVHYRKRSGSFKIREFARSPASEGTTIIFGNEQHWDARTNWRYYRSAVSHDGVEGPMSAEVAMTVTADREPVEGPQQVRDPGFESTVINAARKSNAGSGFDFVVTGGRTRASFSTTTPELNLGVGETSTKGRTKVQENETYLLKCKARRVGLSAASVRGRVAWFDDTGTQIGSTVNVFTTAVTTTDAEYSGTATAPAGAVRAGVRFTGVSFTGTGTLEMVDPDFSRRVNNARTEDDAQTARTIIASDPLTTKHTITGMLAQAASGSTGFKASPSGLYFYDALGLAFEATSAGVFIRGSLEAGGILIEDDVIDFGGSHSIAYTGTDLIFTAASGFIFDGASTFESTVNVNASLTANGIVSDNDLQAAGQFGVNGVATSGKVTLHNTLTNAQRIAALEALAATFGLATVTA